MPHDRPTIARCRPSRRDFGRVSVGALACAWPAARALADAGPSWSRDVALIKARGNLIVGMTSFDSAPFYYAPQKSDGAGPAGDIQGWDVELARSLARILDVKLVMRRDSPSFDDVIDRVTSGEVDLAISKLSMTPLRAVRVRFTQPVIELRHALLANRVALASREKDGDVSSVVTRAFDGTIGVIAHSSYAQIADQVFAKAKLVEFADWDQVVTAVERRDVELAYRDELEVKKLMRLRPELHLKLRSILITDIRDLIAVAAPSGSDQIVSLMNVMLAQRQQFDANHLLDAYADLFPKRS